MELLKSDQELDPHLAAIRDRYPQEPYRLALAGLRSRLLDAEKSEPPDLLLKPAVETKPVTTKQVARVLDLISESLSSHRAALLAQGDLHRLRQQVSLFGLGVARLDVRQHSGRHESAAAEIFKTLGLCPDYAALDEPARVALLSDILSKPAPALPETGFTPETGDVVGSMRVLKRALELFGVEAVGAYVISMTHDLSDIIEVLAMQHLVGVSLDIAPLFETTWRRRRASWSRCLPAGRTGRTCAHGRSTR
jgi:phosphoenolpyruvate carboxylase